jgi:phage portal protein BeeE
MRLFGMDITFSRKSYEQLRQMIMREKQSADNVALRTQPGRQIESYRSWVFSCVSLISDRVSTMPFKLKNEKTGEELTSKNKNFAVFMKPFRKPNDLMTFRFIRQFCQIQLDLCGMTAIYPVKNKLGETWELWPLNMNDFVKVEVSDSIRNPSVKYFFKSGHNIIDFDINELIVINYPNPTDPYSPMSPI